MRVLVTGGAGYIGSHTCEKLMQEGYSVVVYDNLSTGFREAIPQGADFVFGDVRDSLMLARVMKDKAIQAVVHFAGKLIVHESVEKPLDYYENNTLGVLSLVKACREVGVDKVVFSSTAAVYGEVNMGAKKMLSEETPTAPMNPYGMSKLMSEKILLDCAKTLDIRSVILRYFNVAGASATGKNGPRTKNATQLVKVAAEVACGKRSSLDIFGTDYPTPDGTAIRDYIHVEDLAELHVLGLKYLEDRGETIVLNCGYGQGYSVREVLMEMQKVSGVEFPTVVNQRRSGDVTYMVADPSKAQKLLHWTPKYHSLEMICRGAFDWEKRQQ